MERIMKASLLSDRSVREPAANNGSCARKIASVLQARSAFGKRLVYVRSHPEDKAPVSGDQIVQEQLMAMVRLEMGKQNIKRSVQQFAQEKSENMKQSNEKAKKEVEKQEKLLRQKSKREYDKAMEAINRSADDFEAELRASRAKMEEGKAEFQDWEDRMTKERNQGTFFQQLYESDKQKSRRKNTNAHLHSSKRPNPQKWGTLLTQSEAPGSIQTEIPRHKSNVRASIFVFLAINLSCLAVADMLSSSPTYMLDALHAALAVTLLTSVWFERQLLQPSNREERED